ncbi:ATP-binding protein [Streptomyces sp. C11-1]|uniref:ATP-binding protein n=1 Tax=Streptomyces durocortorensis TaxID=2811104 RepID=A0ABY9VZV2_9ACTN|nr:ATP-binding protein [Streptomyces durocortorensis]WNF28165.1 ATP-binding protein [Streptomyces durocortorensis]
MSIWWSLHLRREAASVPLARRFLLGTMETAGVDPDVSFDLSLALSEACANAVEHGGERTALGEPGDSGYGRTPPDSGQYRVTAYLDGEKCRIEVSDSGPGFPAVRVLRPAGHISCAAESGRGLDLIEQLSDHVQFANRPGRGAVVSFDKVLKWQEGALLTV